MTEPLVVPPPTITFTALADGFAPLEDVVGISFSTVRFADGTAITASDYTGGSALLMRTVAPGAPLEMWDADRRRWRPPGDLLESRGGGLALALPTQGDQPWRAVLVASGQTDATGVPVIAPAAGGFPQYRVRGLFRARRGTSDAAGVGPEGPALLFASKGASARFATRLTPDAEAPTRVQLTLRSAAARAIAQIEMDASGAHPALTLRSFDAGGTPRASVTLDTDGEIRLSPAPGRRVVIAGDLEVERIRYLPASGVPKKTLS